MGRTVWFSLVLLRASGAACELAVSAVGVVVGVLAHPAAVAASARAATRVAMRRVVVFVLLFPCVVLSLAGRIWKRLRGALRALSSLLVGCYRVILILFRFFPYSLRGPYSVSRGSRAAILVRASCMGSASVSCRGGQRMRSRKSRLVTVLV